MTTKYSGLPDLTLCSCEESETRACGKERRRVRHLPDFDKIHNVVKAKTVIANPFFTIKMSFTPVFVASVFS